MSAKPVIKNRLQQLEQLLEERSEQLGQVQGQLLRAPTSDPLTGLSNVSRFLDFLALEWRRARRERFEVSVIRIGIDHFGAYVERLGPEAGDECVRQVAGLLAPLVRRPGDLLARYLGADFVATLSRTPQAGAQYVADRLRAAVEGAAVPHPASPAGSIVTVTMGIATAAPTPSLAWEDLEILAAAARALQLARQTSRTHVAVTVTGRTPAVR